jgi:long-chain acyl-CoA synthetase
MGVSQGDRLVICAHTCPEWQLTEWAALAAGAIVVGVDAHAPSDHLEYVLGHCNASGLVVDSLHKAESLSDAMRKRLRFFVTLERSEDGRLGEGVHSWQELMEGRSATAPATVVSPDTPATLIYTSGTTGQPKAILYRHRHLMAACEAIGGAFPGIGAGDSVLCWLPLAHLLQRMMNLVAVSRGATVYYVDNPREVITCIREVEPSIFVAVPRFYERLYEGIIERVSVCPRWIRATAQAAIRVGVITATYQRAGKRVPLGLAVRHRLADWLVLRRLRRVMGRNIGFMITGSAPTPRWLLEFFHGIGLLVLEAYGVSENTIPMAANRPESFRFGSVGKPFLENEIQLTADSEILVRGPGVFGGYYRDESPEVIFTKEGFYPTGDLGHLDADGFLYITGRKKEIIKTSTGRRISPAKVEATYAQSPFFDQVVVLGNGQKFLVALLSLRREAVARELAIQGIIPTNADGKLETCPEVESLARQQLEHFGQSLPPHERVANFAILPTPLSLERGELTPTLKIRRNQVELDYADLVDNLYHAPPALPAEQPPSISTENPT